MSDSSRLPFSLTVLLTALVALSPLATDLYLPSLPAIGRELGTDAGDARWTLTAFFIGMAVGAPLWGPLADRFGRRPIVLSGVGLLTAASVAAALAPTLDSLTLARFIQALGAAAGPVASRATVRDLATPLASARALSGISAAMGAAPLIAPLIGGQLHAVFGWRAGFYAIALYGVIALIIAAWRFPETRRGPTIPLRPNAIARAYGRLLSDRRLLGYALAGAGAFGTLFAWVSVAPILILDLFGARPEAFGLYFALNVAGYMIGATIASRMRRIGPDQMIAIGLGVATVAGAAAGAALMTGVAGALGVSLLMAVVAIGAGLALANSQAGVVAPYPDHAGMASSAASMIQMSGAALAAAIVGATAVTNPASAGWGVACAGLCGLIALKLLVGGRSAFADQANRPAKA